MLPTKVVRSASGLWHSIVAVRSLIFCDRRKRVSSVANLGGIHYNIHSSDLKNYCEKIPVLEVCLPVKVCRHNTSPSVFVWGCQQHHITGEFVAVLNTKDIANADLKISHFFLKCVIQNWRWKYNVYLLWLNLFDYIVVHHGNKFPIYHIVCLQ